MDEKTLTKVREVRDRTFWDASILLQNYIWDQKTDIRVTTLSKMIRLRAALQISSHCQINFAAASDETWRTLLLPADDVRGRSRDPRGRWAAI